MLHMESIEEKPAFIDFAVAFDEWEDYVVAFRVKLGQETYPDGPSIAVFWLNKVQRLRVIRANKSLLAGVPSFTDVPSAELVQTIYDLMSDDIKSKKPYYIRVTAVRDNEVVHSNIRIAEFKFGKGELVERNGGVIHNPPYVAEQ